MKWLALLCLAGCAVAPLPTPPVPPAAVKCPGPVAIPAALPHLHTQEQLLQFAIRLEVAREDERARGDCYAKRIP